MTKDEIQDFASNLLSCHDEFSHWAYSYIQSSYSEWLEIMNPADCSLQGTMSDVYHVIGIELDFYWLLECRDRSELTLLLKSWHDNKEDNG